MVLKFCLAWKMFSTFFFVVSGKFVYTHTLYALRNVHGIFICWISVIYGKSKYIITTLPIHSLRRIVCVVALLNIIIPCCRVFRKLGADGTQCFYCFGYTTMYYVLTTKISYEIHTFSCAMPRRSVYQLLGVSGLPYTKYYTVCVEV